LKTLLKIHRRKNVNPKFSILNFNCLKKPQRESCTLNEVFEPIPTHGLSMRPLSQLSYSPT